MGGSFQKDPAFFVLGLLTVKMLHLGSFLGPPQPENEANLAKVTVEKN
jgi:hypothetical protein